MAIASTTGVLRPATVWQYRGQSLKELMAEGKLLPELIEAADNSPLLAQLLYNRGVRTPEAIRAFMNLEDYQPTSACELPDVEPAVERILKAIEIQEHILIYGDFDVDGITGTSILYQALKQNLNANVSFYIPDRATEGHGLNNAALLRLVSSRKVKLVITTDTGITNFAEVSLLKGLGVDTVVTDHHALPENLPPAVANVNPQRLLDEQPDHPLGLMCGAGVAYKLCEILFEKRLSPSEARAAADSLLDLTAIGTVVDMVPLVRENRYLVYRGLQILNRRQRPGLVELLEQAGVKPEAKLNSETLGFTIGPRLNALGRLEKADQGVELLTSQDSERIRIIAAHLEFLNRKRRELCDQTFLQAETYLQSSGGLGDRRCIILGSPDWNPGIVGIVASRLIEKYHVPVFMMVIDEEKGLAKCSARSIPGFHLHDELSKLSSYFEGFGGHAGAGGFALKLEKLESFKRDLYALTAQTVTEEQMRPVVAVDALLEWSQLNPYLVEQINRLAPFGMENPSPRFVLESVAVSAQKALGEGERHLKLILTGNGKGQPVEALIWNHGNRERFDIRHPYSFVVVPELNTFNNATKLQLIVEDYLAPETARMAVEQKVDPMFHAIQPKTPSDAIQAVLSDGGGIQWLDHRNRESLETFVGQLVMPLKQQGKRFVVFHEGRQPEIPFLEVASLRTRHEQEPVDELILWDLPPSATELNQIIKQADPKVVHLMGGKYQTVPLFPTERTYLKIILQMLRRLAEDSFELDQLAARLALSRPALVNGLILLEKLQMLEVRLIGKTDEPGKERFRYMLKTENGSQAEMDDWLEFLMFRQSLEAMGQFRDWLLSASLDTIKTSLMHETIR